MNLKTIALFLFGLGGAFLTTQSQGISFSYLFPTNGYLAAPVSPFSVRGLGLDMGFVEVETGFTLYSVPGLSMTDLPFESKKPLIGPGYATLVPLELSLGVDAKLLSIKVLGGGFGVWNINPRINYGNFDRALKAHEGWDVANADVSINNKLGLGWMAGISLAFHVSEKFSLTTEVHYLSGDLKTPVSGSYTGGIEGGTIETRPIDYPDAKTLLQGWEISLGVNMN